MTQSRDYSTKPHAHAGTTRRVAVIVLNWNGWADTLICLESLRQPVEAGLCRIVLVDNASTDGSSENISAWMRGTGRIVSRCSDAETAWGESAEYVLIKSQHNRGYAGGNNLGIRCALRFEGTQYLFVLNNDTILRPDTLTRLTNFADSNPTAAILGSTIVEENGLLRIAGGARYNPLLTTSTLLRASKTAHKATAAMYVSGAAMFVRAEVFRSIGLFCEDYFLYFEELDFARRATQAGFRSAWCEESVLFHARGRSSGSRSGRNGKKSYLAEYHSTLSCLIFTRKYHRHLFWIASIARLLTKLFYLPARGQPSLVRAMLSAYYAFFTTAYTRPT